MMRKQSLKFKFSLVFFFIALMVLSAAIIIRAIPAFALAAGENTDTAPGNDERFVIIYDRDQKTTIKTSATTVQEVLLRSKIDIDASDVVEPALDEEIFADNFRINIYRARPVIVSDGAHKFRFMTAQSDPLAVAEAAGLKLRPEDVVKITASSDFLETGIAPHYQVFRAKQLFFNFYGANTEIYTQADTVAEFIADQNIKLQSEDWLSSPENSKLLTGQSLSLYRQGANTISLEEDISFATQVIYDYDRPVGYRAITQTGIAGKRTVTYEIFMHNGVEQSRQLLASIVTIAPINQIETLGARYKSSDALNKAKGVNYFTDSKAIIHRETYYDLDMSIVMKNCGQGGYYSVRGDGVKVDRAGYVIVAANLGRYPRCSIVETSLGLGKVYDTGGFIAVHPDGFDIATDWTIPNDGK